MKPTDKIESSPYVGTESIQTGQALFGRDHEIELLTDLLIARRIVLLHSPSGAGKTSLINAGLLPALVKEHFTVLPVVRVNKAVPMEVQAVSDPSQVNRYTISALLSLDADPSLAVRLTASELSTMDLETYLELRRPPDDPDQPLLLILDQFEELLTADPIDLDKKQQFMIGLGKALEDRRTWALFSMREDFVGGLDPFLQYIPTQLSARVRLDLLSKEGAEQAIRRPTPEDEEFQEGLYETFTQGAASLLAEDLRTMLVQQEGGKRLAQPGPYIEPVQLQVVCWRLWQNRGNTSQVDESILSAAGTVDEALEGHYADTVRQIAEELKDRGVREWMIRDWFDRKLITTGGIRGQVMMGEGNSTEGLDNQAINRLIAKYLVRSERRRGVTWYELAHDRLVDPIRTNNARWRESNLSSYHPRAVRYVNEGRPKSLLLTPTEIKEMELWESQHQGDLTYEEEELLETSRIELRERQKQRSTMDFESDLSQAGWGVIFSETAAPVVREMLSDLLALRKSQAGSLYREFIYKNDPPETANQFLARNGAVAGLVNPEVIPYYLLLVGSLDEIPLDFQYQMDLNYAVGRLWFETPGEFRTYARSVVLAESGQIKLARRMTLFAPSHPGDRPTQMVETVLAPALIQHVRKEALDPAWETSAIKGSEATKSALLTLVGERESPPLLAIFGHGVAVGFTDPSFELSDMGAVVTADWPGPISKAKIGLEPGMVFKANDLADDVNLVGTVLLLSSGYSAGGAPGRDDFNFRPEFRRREQPPSAPMLAPLPLRLLGIPRGGALAVIAHYDRNWMLEGGKSEAMVFGELLLRLMQGNTVGAAMTVLNDRYAYYASRLSDVLRQQMITNQETTEQGAPSAAYTNEITTLMTGLVDTRNYIVLGDPAARLPLAESPAEVLPRIDLPVDEVQMVYEGETSESVSYPSAPARQPAQEIMGMNDTAYPVLDLEIAATEGTYSVQARFTTPDMDVGIQAFGWMPLDVESLAELQTDMTAYGRELTQALVSESEVSQVFQQALSTAQSQGLPLRVRLILQAEPDQPLAAIHWETLQLPGGGGFLATSSGILLSRYVAATRPVRLRPPTRGGMRTLAMLEPESPYDSVLSQISQVEKYARNVQSRTEIKFERTTDSNLVFVLATAPVDILILVGEIRLNKGQPQIGTIDGPGLAGLVESLRQAPRLVVLVATPGANEEAGGALLFAHLLVQSGIPAAMVIPPGTPLEVGMQVLRVFLDEITRDGQVDRAAAAARQGVSNQADFWRPLLLTRLRSGRLWFLGTSEGDGETINLAPPPPPTFVDRLVEQQRLVQAVLQRAAAPTPTPIVMTSAPGYGKSTLARAVCATPEVKKAFTGGILWINFQNQTLTPARLFDTLTGALTGEAPRSRNLDEARGRFHQAVSGLPVLLVLDDILEREAAAPFVSGLPGVTVLLTTSSRSLLPPPAELVWVGPLNESEAMRLLSDRLPVCDNPAADHAALAALARRLGYWPAALYQAAELLRQRTSSLNQTCVEAAAYLQRSLDRPGQDILGIKSVLAPDLQRIDPYAPERYAELGIFMPGETIPLAVIERLWAKTGWMDAPGTRKLLDALVDNSLVEWVPGNAGEPEAVRAVSGPVELAASFWTDPSRVHNAFLSAYEEAFKLPPWANLPTTETYLWMRLAYHLNQAGRLAELDELLRDLEWMRTLMGAAGIHVVLNNYRGLKRGQPSSITGDALRLSANALSKDPTQLPAQLSGRLYSGRPEINQLLEQVQITSDPNTLLPVFPSLATTEGPLTATYPGPDGAVLALAIAPRGDFAVVAVPEGLVRVQLETGDTTHWLIKESAADLVITSSDLVIAAHRNGSLTIRDLNTGEGSAAIDLAENTRSWKPVMTLIDSNRPRVEPGTPGAKPELAAALNSGSPLLLVGDESGTVTWINLETQARIEQWRWAKAAVSAITLLPDGQSAAVVFANHRWTSWSLVNGKKQSSGQQPGGSMNALLSFNDARLLAYPEDNRVELFPLMTHVKESVNTLVGVQGRLTALAALPNRSFLGLAEGMVQAWLPSGDPDWAQPTAGPANLLAVTPDGQRAVSAGTGSPLQTWTPERGRGLSGMGQRGRVLALAVSPNMGLAAAVMADSTLVLYDLMNGRQRVLRETGPDEAQILKSVARKAGPAARGVISTQIRAAALVAADLKTVVSSANPAIIDWEIKTGRAKRTTLPTALFDRVVLSYDGQVGVFLEENGRISAIDLHEMVEIAVLSEAEMVPTALAISRSGQWTAAGDNNGRLTAWNLPEPTPQRVFGAAVRRQAIEALDLSDDGELVLVGFGQTARLFKGKRLQHEFSFEAPVASLSMTPDGSLAAAAAGNELLLLDLQAGEILSRFTTDGPLFLATLSPDGQFAAAAGMGGIVHVLTRPRPPMTYAA